MSIIFVLFYFSFLLIFSYILVRNDYQIKKYESKKDYNFED